MQANIAHTVDRQVRQQVVASLTSGGLVDVTSTVFVIDDDISVRESLERLVRTAGCQPPRRRQSRSCRCAAA